MLKILREKQTVAAGGAGVIEACTVIVPPFHIIRRAECLIASVPTVYPDVATGFLDNLFLVTYPPTLDVAAHLLSQEPLTGRGVVSWDGELHTGNMSMQLTAWFSDLTAGDQMELVVVIEDERKTW